MKTNNKILTKLMTVLALAALISGEARGEPFKQRLSNTALVRRLSNTALVRRLSNTRIGTFLGLKPKQPLGRQPSVGGSVGGNALSIVGAQPRRSSVINNMSLPSILDTTSEGLSSRSNSIVSLRSPLRSFRSVQSELDNPNLPPPSTLTSVKTGQPWIQNAGRRQGNPDGSIFNSPLSTPTSSRRSSAQSDPLSQGFFDQTANIAMLRQGRADRSASDASSQGETIATVYKKFLGEPGLRSNSEMLTALQNMYMDPRTPPSRSSSSFSWTEDTSPSPRGTPGIRGPITRRPLIDPTPLGDVTTQTLITPVYLTKKPQRKLVAELPEYQAKGELRGMATTSIPQKRFYLDMEDIIRKPEDDRTPLSVVYESPELRQKGTAQGALGLKTEQSNLPMYKQVLGLEDNETIDPFDPIRLSDFGLVTKEDFTNLAFRTNMPKITDPMILHESLLFEPEFQDQLSPSAIAKKYPEEYANISIPLLNPDYLLMDPGLQKTIKTKVQNNKEVFLNKKRAEIAADIITIPKNLEILAEKGIDVLSKPGVAKTTYVVKQDVMDLEYKIYRQTPGALRLAKFANTPIKFKVPTVLKTVTPLQAIPTEGLPQINVPTTIQTYKEAGVTEIPKTPMKGIPYKVNPTNSPQINLDDLTSEEREFWRYSKKQ